MAWLYEAYLNETKEANKTPEHDHPEQIGASCAVEYKPMRDTMKNMEKKKETDRITRRAGALQNNSDPNVKADYFISNDIAADKVKDNGKNSEEILDYVNSIRNHNRKHPNTQVGMP